MQVSLAQAMMVVEWLKVLHLITCGCGDTSWAGKGKSIAVASDALDVFLRCTLFRQ